MGFTYMLVVPGRSRWYAKLAIVAFLAGVSLDRIYLGTNHPTDLVFAVILGVAIPVTLFRAFTPTDIFPVAYGHRGKSAHLDVSGRRGEAIKQAMLEQLGFTILEMKLVGLEGSGGSTPLKLRVSDEHGVERSVFAKLYAKNHVRADRWYKFGRVMLYGRLEDETPFKTVRRFVEYEDYTLRLLGEYGFPTPSPWASWRSLRKANTSSRWSSSKGQKRTVTPTSTRRSSTRGSRSSADVGRGLGTSRYQTGQPDGARWSPPVDRCLLRAGPAVTVAASRRPREHDAGARAPLGYADVYEKALAYFSPEELSEAFAATRGVASPTQLRNFMKRDGRDLLEQFRSFVPERRPVTTNAGASGGSGRSSSRWSWCSPPAPSASRCSSRAEAMYRHLPATRIGP